MSDLIVPPPPIVTTLTPPPAIVTTLAPPPAIDTTLVVGQGPAGPSGAGLASYTHTQAIAAASWTVNHDLNRQPSAVSLRSPGGVEFVAEWLVTSLNQLVVLLSAPTTGTAHVI